MILRSLLILLAVAGNVQAAPSPAGSSEIIPATGPHTVGLRIVQQYDYSRELQAPVDAFGKAGNVGPARPIQTLVWYPAKRTGAVFAAARSSRFKGLVSLDGSIRYHPKIWNAATYVRASRTAVPMMFLGARTPSAEQMERNDKLGPGYLNTMKYSDVYVTTAPPMRHQDFSSLDLRFSADGTFGDYQRAEVLQAYRSVALYTRQFLDAYLKNDSSALAFLKQSPARNGIGPR